MNSNHGTTTAESSLDIPTLPNQPGGAFKPNTNQDGADYGPSLLPQHQKILRESGIAPEVARARGYRSIQTRKEIRDAGFGDHQGNFPALLFPIHNVGGRLATFQIRPDQPRVSRGKPVKYELPTGTPMVLDVPPASRKDLQDPKVPLFITEGVRKADSAVSIGLCCVALLGVWNFRGTNKEGGKVALGDWENVALNERLVYIVFDSDVMQKPEVYQALVRLKGFLESRTAIVNAIYLPPKPDGAKLGLDDFFVSGKSVEDLLALASSEVRGIATEAKDKIRVRYTARPAEVPGLVDIVEDQGRSAFLIKEGADLSLKEFVMLGGERLEPPPYNTSRPFLLPRAGEVIKAYKAQATQASHEADQGIYDDLVSFLRSVSELPGEGHYDFLAAYVLHTYLMPSFQYTPIVVFHAVPGRGKSRTGKALTAVCFRGIHVGGLRDPYLLRVATDWEATLFVDGKDIWKMAERANCQDILLNRFERGAKVPRVNFPDRGPHQDTVYYDVFGPTIIATNRDLHDILETRSVIINMREARQEFENEVTPATGQSLRERLTAFRARHLESVLPDIAKPARGRLGDILKPLFQVVQLVRPDRESSLRQIAEAVEGSRTLEKSSSLEAHLLEAVASLRGSVNNGHLAVELITSAINNDFNAGLSERFKLTPQKVGRMLKALGFAKGRTGTGAAAIVWDDAELARLCQSYGLDQISDISESSTAPGEGPRINPDLSDVSECSKGDW